MADIIKQIARELGIRESQAKSAAELIDQGNTVPFIARYRKEVTDGLSDETLRALMGRLAALRRLEERKQEVIRLIAEQGKMTPGLEAKISGAGSVTEVDDLYRPYRPKRRTKATVAKEKGLEPLAALLWAQQTPDREILRLAQDYVSEGKEVFSADEAVAGARDIVAEMISDDAELRKRLRTYIWKSGNVTSKAAVKDSTVYDMYYDFLEPVSRLVPHRVLALNRGEKEKILGVKIDAEEDGAMQIMHGYVMKPGWRSDYLKTAAQDAYKRLIYPAIEREIRNELSENADEQAIRVFGENLKNLLLQPPVKGKTVLALDPGYRTGNKVAVVDATGKVLDTGVVYMTLEHHDIEKAKGQLKSLIEKHRVDIIAIGNGTASKETEMATAALLKELGRTVYYMVVNEAGASVYSASKLGTEEFPEFDVALRSAVSIARRLQDPLAELVKIDPKAIGVGQYQHDVNQKRLAEMLEGVVETCVNTVGVDLNTASPSLLKYISGISPAVAQNIVAMRDQKGGFSSRAELKEVQKLGGKAFEQCAGFLRIPGAKNVLDNTAIHPESYGAVGRLMQLQGYRLTGNEDLAGLRKEIDTWDVPALADKIGIGQMTLKDILGELKKPGRDPREAFDQPVLRSDVMHLEDLKEGMVLTGTVRNVIDFGAFVDIGVHQDGLVHISELCQKYVKHPMDGV
ncbi:MAG: Tex family protein, partial [Eubacteriales bacterium]|nr:Tex family protein [Eubacteriales bacterium]